MIEIHPVCTGCPAYAGAKFKTRIKYKNRFDCLNF